MKKFNFAIFILILSATNLSSALNAIAQTDASIEVRGTLQRYLMNAHGQVDGLLLTDGTQIRFPPHMSKKLISVISPKDEVSAKGFRENKNVFNAEFITNMKTRRSLGASVPFLNAFEQEDLYGNPMPRPNRGMNSHIGQKQMSASGKIQTQLFDRRGRVNGVILSDDSIVHFRKIVEEESNVYLDVGQPLSASGYGTANAFGKTLEADKISN